MMDFPSSPTTGQTYSISGGPTYVYNGTAWVVLTPGNQFNRTVFTATAGQTTFTMNYVVGAIDVYRNGVKLAPADFTATNGTSIVLANSCTVGDTIEVISYPMITYSDAVKRTGDTMTGALALSTTGAAFSATDGTSTTRLLNSGGVGIVGTQSNHPFIIQTNDTERLRVDTGGRVLTPNQPIFSGYRSSGANWVGSASVSIWVVNQPYVNNGNCYNTSNGYFTCPVAGYYRIFGSALMGNTGYATLFMVKNGVVSVGLAHGNANGASHWYVTSFQVVVYCAANDTLAIGYQTPSGGGFIYDSTYNSVTIELIG